MKKITKTQAAYIAGFFDGEGSVCCFTSSRQLYPRIRICITQKFPGILHSIAKTINSGNVHIIRNSRKGKSYKFYRLTISARRDVTHFIKTILPCSKIKTRQLEKALQIIKLTPHIGKRVTTKIQTKRIKLGKEICKLKKQEGVVNV